jgi:hypothetical protein
MKTNREPENDEALNRTLREWAVENPLPPRFQEGVWQRIARVEAAPEPGFVEVLRRLLQVVLPQRNVAVVYVTALAVLGILAGSWAAQVKSTRTEATLGSRYVQSVDPYAGMAGR